jgi:DNA polymerase-4/DNA polymerase V
MFAVLRSYTPQVEEYSIDEAFADVTGMRRALRLSYEGIAAAIQRDIARELGITVSVGLSLTKVLAKCASKLRKPAGLTVISGRSIVACLRDLPVGKIWGIGPATTAYLNKMGVRTALEFARLSEAAVRRHLTKRGWKSGRSCAANRSWP